LPQADVHFEDIDLTSLARFLRDEESFTTVLEKRLLLDIFQGSAYFLVDRTIYSDFDLLVSLWILVNCIEQDLRDKDRVH
jgi:hypothetical protein